MSGTIGILNVGCGDTKLVFDKDNPADCIRAARIVSDMLRRGYALLVEVTHPDGAKKYQRVHKFKEDTFEYIIADLDPLAAAEADAKEATDESAAETSPDAGRKQTNGRRRKDRTISATGAKAVAVARTAGG